MAVPFEIGVGDLDRMIKSGEPPVIVDVREPWEYSLCAIEGSVPIPLGTLPQRAGELPTDKDIVVVCHHGGRSAQATMWLRSKGFVRTINLDGGIDAWARQIDPNMKVY